MSEIEKVPLRKRSWFIILLLIFFFPVGLYLMWRHANWSKTPKWVVTGVIAVLAAYSLGSQDTPTDTADTTNTPTNQTAVQDTEPAEDEEVEAAQTVEKTEPVEEVETKSGKQEESASEDEEIIEEEQAEEVIGVGETLTVDEIDFTINDWYQQDVVGNFLTSNANDTYLILDVSVTNNQNESAMMMSNYFKIVDGETVYEPDSVASTYANQAVSPDNLGLLAEEINPGSSRDALIVYDVTQSVIDSSTKQLQVQSGMFGTETGIINLQ